MPPTEPGRSGSTRATPVALIAVSAVLLVARVATGVWEHHRPPGHRDRVAWRAPADGAKEARRTGRPILYDFTADWCAPCRQMQREVFADRGAAERIERAAVPVRVLDRRREEGRNPPEVEELETRFRVSGFPTLIVADPGGRRFETQVGYRGPATTLHFIRNAAARVASGLPRHRGTQGDTPGPSSDTMPAP